MNCLSNRKVVLVIVEGPSDDIALGYFFSRLFDPDQVHVHVVRGDITTRSRERSGSIVKLVTGIVTKYANNRHFHKDDFAQIIQVTDMDGSFVPDEDVKLDRSHKDVRYYDDGIHCNDVPSLLGRNRQKQRNLRTLVNTGKIWDIPYSIYYMSCNLDHVLYDQRNCSDTQKDDYAEAFLKKYRNDVDGFVNYLSFSTFSKIGNYQDSWEFIEQGRNSLMRYTNLGICLLKAARDKEDQTGLS